MDQIKTVTKQDLRDLILRCYKQCISEDITDLDISFTPFYIEVKIPEGQQPAFNDNKFSDIPELKKFGNKIQLYSFGKLRMAAYYTEQLNRIQSKVLSIDIAYNYQIEE